jgi:hypothetical protein
VSWQRLKYIEQTKVLADAENSQRWSTTTMLALLRVVYHREWRGLLNANPTYRWALRTVTSNTDGRVDIGDLDTVVGDASELFYRVLAVAVNDKIYKEGNFRDYPLTLPGNNYAEELTYIPFDFYLQLIPAEAGIPVKVWVNHTPQPIDELTSDAAPVEFPRGYEMLLCYEAAGLMLTKGGVETGAAADLLAVAAEMRADMLADTRRTTNPIQFRYGDSRGEWGG